MKDELTGWLNAVDFDKVEKVQAVTAIYDKLGIRELTENRINMYFDRGFDCFEQIKADADRKNVLIQFTRQLIERES